MNDDIESKGVYMPEDQFSKVIEMLTKIDKELTEFKGDVNTKLQDTNGRLKGNHELILQKIQAHEKENDMRSEVTNAQIKAIEAEIKNHKTSISQLYDLERGAARSSEESNALVIREVDEKVTGFSERIDKRIDENKGSIIRIENTLKLMLGALSIISPVLIMAVVYGVMMYQKVFGG